MTDSEDTSQLHPDKTASCFTPSLQTASKKARCVHRIIDNPAIVFIANCLWGCTIYVWKHTWFLQRNLVNRLQATTFHFAELVCFWVRLNDYLGLQLSVSTSWTTQLNSGPITMAVLHCTSKLFTKVDTGIFLKYLLNVLAFYSLHAHNLDSICIKKLTSYRWQQYSIAKKDENRNGQLKNDWLSGWKVNSLQE